MPEVPCVSKAEENIDKRSSIIYRNAEERRCKISKADKEPDHSGLVKGLEFEEHAEHYHAAGDYIEQARLYAEELGVLEILVVGGAYVMRIEESLNAEAEERMIFEVSDSTFPELPACYVRRVICFLDLEGVLDDIADIAEKPHNA